MFDNTNPYTIRFEETDGRKRYFVAFTDGQGNFRETEVSKAVYMEFCHFIKRERNLRRSDERHLEQSELTEETLCRRAVHKPKPVDDAVNDNIRMERLNRAIMELPEIQKRRFMLHFDLGLTYEQIGAMEGCTKMPIKKYRKGVEYGSARWGTAKDIAPYIDPKFENNILLTQTERLTMTGRPKGPKTARNKNVLVIGGSGSGKTRFFVKPNLMQCFPTTDYPTSFVVTDPKGTLVLETGKMFQQAGYRIKILNTINFSKSMKYNPFVYIHSEKDVLKLVNTLIANTKGEGEKSAEDFWVKSERLFYMALIGYIWYEAPAEEMNFTTLLEMINASEAREDDPEFQSPVDLMFERLEQKDPDHFAVRQYKKFLLSAGKTRSSILISCGARLAPFDIREVRELMEDDEMELDTIGDEKTVLFLIMSDTDTTFNFILAMLQSQLINLLCDRAMIKVRRTTACPCAADLRRVCQHRSDTKL